MVLMNTFISFWALLGVFLVFVNLSGSADGVKYMLLSF